MQEFRGFSDFKGQADQQEDLWSVLSPCIRHTTRCGCQSTCTGCWASPPLAKECRTQRWRWNLQCLRRIWSPGTKQENDSMTDSVLLPLWRQILDKDDKRVHVSAVSGWLHVICFLSDLISYMAYYLQYYLGRLEKPHYLMQIFPRRLFFYF